MQRKKQTQEINIIYKYKYYQNEYIRGIFLFLFIVNEKTDKQEDAEMFC